MQSTESLIEEIDKRNKKINDLKAEIEQIYIASSFLIKHAQNTPNDGGLEALRDWDKVRPNSYKGEYV